MPKRDPQIAARGRERKRMPWPGDTWRSRDKRDENVTVTVQQVDADAEGYVFILRRGARRKVLLRRWHREYEFVDGRYA